MDIFGIGPLEFLLILLVALIILGPSDMAKTGRAIGRYIRKLIVSDEWRTLQQATQEIRQIPTRLVHETEETLDEVKKELPTLQDIRQDAGIDKMEKDLNEWEKDVSTWVTPPKIDEVTGTPPSDQENNPVGFPLPSKDKTPEKDV